MANGALNNALAQALFKASASKQWTPSERDLRNDKTQKGTGYFGVLKRPDGGVSTEISIGVNLGGKETDIPALVPTLNAQEVNHLLSTPVDEPIPRPIIDKAVKFAIDRIKLGLSPFASNEEIPYGIKQ